MLISGGSARCSPEKRKLIFLPIRLLYQISWSVVKKFTKFLDCKSNFSVFSSFCKSCISWKVDFKGDCKGGFWKAHSYNCSTGTVIRYLFAIPVSQGGAVLFAPPRKALAFLTTPSVCQKHDTGISLPAGSDQGYSPWTSPAFLKNCWIKKLFVACGSSFKTTILSICS